MTYRPSRRGVYDLEFTPYTYTYGRYTFYFQSMSKLGRFIRGKDVHTAEMTKAFEGSGIIMYKVTVTEYSLIMWYNECQLCNFRITQKDGGKECTYIKLSEMDDLKIGEI